MKRIVSHKLSIGFILLFIFISGQLLGAAAIKYYFIQSKMDELRPLLTAIGDEIANGIKIRKCNDHIVKAYTAQGEEMDIFTEETKSRVLFDDVNFKEALTPHIPEIVSGQTMAELQKIPNLPSRSIIIGQPLVREGNVIGVIFLLKPASDYKAALDGFYIVFFITLSLGATVMLFFLHLFVKERNALEKMRKDYIANISHELKSPIASIKALTETLADNVVEEPERIHHYYHIILRESTRLEKLITDLLELSRLQHDDVVFPKSVIATSTVIETVAQPFAIIASDMGLRFQVGEQIRNLPPTYSNEDRIAQVLVILLDNALKFTPENGLIVLDANVRHKTVEITVSNDGPGIPKEALSRVFDRFYKEDSARNTDGSGLGLSIAQEVVRSLGETIHVGKSDGHTTTFSFTIRRA